MAFSIRNLDAITLHRNQSLVGGNLLTTWLKSCFSAVAIVGLTCNISQVRAITVDTFSPTPQSSGWIADGGDDQFDGGSVLVNGSSYNGGVPVGASPSWTLGTQSIGNIDVDSQVDLLVANGTTTANTRIGSGFADFVYSRHYYEFTNTSGLIEIVTVNFNYNLGSNGSTIVASDSSGNGSVGPNDIWVVTDDGVDGGPAETGTSQDPAVGSILADGTGLIPSAWSPLFGDGMNATFDLSIASGDTQALLFFIASRNETDTFPQTGTRAQTAADVLSLLASPSLVFSGLQSHQANSVVNFIIPEPTTTTYALTVVGLCLVTRRLR